MRDETPYITPNLLMAVSFTNLLDDYRQYGRYLAWAHEDAHITPQDILGQQLVFVVGEPGQGKSRLLAELLKQASGQKALLDLKIRGRDETIDSLIKAQLPHWKPEVESVVLLDGLDEVAQADIQHAIRRIKEYVRNHPDHRVIIASRLHYFAQYTPQFSDLTQARYVMVEPLELKQSRQFLASLGISDAKIQTIIKSLRFKRDDPLVVQNPRYLEFLAEFIKANPSITENINRAIIFDNFVDNALKSEDAKNGTSLKQIKRRFLERVALTMEIAQVNTISERGFTTFLDNAKSDAKLALLAQTTVDDLYVHSLLKKDKDDNVSFDNAEMQEYLAAKAILDMKDKWHTLFDIAIDPNLRELYPSWENTVSFLIDEMPELLPELANLKDAPDAVAVDESWHRLLTGSTSHKLSGDYKRDIYERVSKYYFDRNLPIADEIAFNLANYIPDEQLQPLIEVLNTQANDEAAKIMLVNVTRIIGYAASLDRLTHEQRSAVRSRMIELAKTSKEAHIQREMVDALGEFRDETVLAELMPLISSTDSMILDSLQALANELNRNCDEAIRIFVAGIKNPESHFGRHGLLGVDSADGVKRALDAIAADNDILFQLIEHNSLFKDEEDGFLEVMQSNWQAEWLASLKQIILNSLELEYGHYAVRSSLIAKIIKLIGEKDPSYFAELLAATSDKNRILADEFSNALASIMRKDDAAVLAQAIKDIDPAHLGRFLFSILRVLPNSGNPEAADIEEEARALLPDMYKNYDRDVAESKKKGPYNPALEALNKHIANARSGEPQSLQSVAEAMQDLTYDSRNGLLESTSEDDLEFLWQEAKKNILDPYDPADTQVKITARSDDGAQSYNISRFLNVFSLSVEYGAKTHRKDIASYRAKLINLVPYAYNDSLEAIFNTVGEMNAEEQKAFIDAYSDLSTDKAQFMLGNLLQVAEKYNVQDAAPILDKVVDLDGTTIWNREKALELSQAFVPDEKRLKQVFDTYISDDKLKALAMKANALLITKHNNEQALKWLIKYVQDNAFEFVQPTGAHSVDFREHELHDGDIIAALNDVKDPKYLDLYLEMWQKGADLMAKGAVWESYAYYLWKAVDQYFSNLLSEGDYEPLSRLEKHVSSYQDKVASARYINRLAALKRSYLEAVGKPTVFADAVNAHNELVAKNYVAISSDAKLYEIVHEALDKDWRGWVTQEGRVFVLEKTEQKYIFMELRLILQNKDFPKEGLRVLRESQAVDGTGTDFLVYYNFYGPVVVELKRSDHGDLKGTLESKESYASMEKYMREFSAKKGILLVYDDRNMSDAQWSAFVKKLNNAYEKIPGVEVIAVRVVVKTDKK